MTVAVGDSVFVQPAATFLMTVNANGATLAGTYTGEINFLDYLISARMIVPVTLVGNPLGYGCQGAPARPGGYFGFHRDAHDAIL